MKSCRSDHQIRSGTWRRNQGFVPRQNETRTANGVSRSFRLLQSQQGAVRHEAAPREACGKSWPAIRGCFSRSEQVLMPGRMARCPTVVAVAGFVALLAASTAYAQTGK